jgi:hypothetical protein
MTDRSIAMIARRPRFVSSSVSTASSRPALTSSVAAIV